MRELMIMKDLKNKKKKIINWSIFPIEFIISLLMTYSFFRFVLIRNCELRISIKHIVFTLFFGIVLLIIMIYNFKENKDKIEKIIISLLIPLGMMYLLFMIPSHVPDELAHLWKTYEVSEGKFINEKNKNTEVPHDLVFKIKPHVDNYKELYKALGEETSYDNKVEVNNTARNYPFFLYIFGALGFIIARILNLNILYGCYLAQMMNFIVFLIATYFSVKIIPFGKLAISSIAFTPMLLHQATSTSSDCLINVLAMLFISLSVKLIFKEKSINRKEGILYVVLSILMSISKYVYLPLVGLVLLFVCNKNITKKNKIILITTTIVLSTVLAARIFCFYKQY